MAGHRITWEGSVRVEVPREQADRAYTTARKRSASMGDRDTRNSRNWTGGPGWQRHVSGARVEMAYAWWSGHPFDDKTIGRGDKGYDFPGGVETKYGGGIGRGKLCPRLLFGFRELEAKVKRSAKREPLAWMVLGTVRPEPGHLVVVLIGAVALLDFQRGRYRFNGPGGLCWAFDGEHLGPMALVEHLTLRKEDDGVPRQRNLL